MDLKPLVPLVAPVVADALGDLLSDDDNNRDSDISENIGYSEMITPRQASRLIRKLQSVINTLRPLANIHDNMRKVS